jgi:hypothetical protein
MASQTAERAKQSDNQGLQPRPDRGNRESTGEDFYDFVSEISDSCQRYCVRRPRVVAGVIFGLGFVIGWKLKPW